MTIFRAFSPNRSAKMAKKTRAKKKVLNRDKVISVALSLTETDGWAAFSMADVAEKSNVTTHDVIKEFPSKIGLLWGIIESFDRTVLIEQTESDEPPRERLFDVLMDRFDALNPYKPAIKSIARASSLDPLMSLLTLPRFMLSMSWMLEAAGISSAGLKGLLRTKGLAIVYLNTARVWLRDETPDMSKTMAALDQNLRRAERIAGLCNLGR
jgi:AcrR family transcriptional regulator